MSELGPIAAPVPPQDTGVPLEELVESLRTSAAARRDPARFRFLQALARRLPGQQEAVRRLLEDKLRAGVAEFAARERRQEEASGSQRQGAGSAPLVRLNEYVRTATATRGDGVATGDAREPDELASVRRFRKAWEMGRTLEQVERAVARKPAQAGPLNSHLLLLQSLALMRELSPEYLRRFVAHVETLQWLEHAGATSEHDPARQKGAARRPRGSRAKK